MKDSTVSLFKLYSGVCIFLSIWWGGGTRQLYRTGLEENISVKKYNSKKVPYNSESKYVQSWLVVGKKWGRIRELGENEGMI